MGEFVADRGCVIFAPIANVEFKPPVKTRPQKMQNFITIKYQMVRQRIFSDLFWNAYTIIIILQMMFIYSKGKVRNAQGIEIDEKNTNVLYYAPV